MMTFCKCGLLEISAAWTNLCWKLRIRYWFWWKTHWPSWYIRYLEFPCSSYSFPQVRMECADGGSGSLRPAALGRRDWGTGSSAAREALSEDLQMSAGVSQVWRIWTTDGSLHRTRLRADDVEFGANPFDSYPHCASTVSVQNPALKLNISLFKLLLPFLATIILQNEILCINCIHNSHLLCSPRKYCRCTHVNATGI